MSEERPRTGDAIYTIGVVARLTGLSARQIRYYETLELVQPVRSQGNQRLYTRRDIDRLKEMRSLRAERLPLEAIARVMGTTTPRRGSTTRMRG